jgi:hypothetical protein
MKKEKWNWSRWLLGIGGVILVAVLVNNLLLDPINHAEEVIGALQRSGYEVTESEYFHSAYSLFRAQVSDDAAVAGLTLGESMRLSQLYNLASAEVTSILLRKGGTIWIGIYEGENVATVINYAEAMLGTGTSSSFFCRPGLRTDEFGIPYQPPARFISDGFVFTKNNLLVILFSADQGQVTDISEILNRAPAPRWALSRYLRGCEAYLD